MGAACNQRILSCVIMTLLLTAVCAASNTGDEYTEEPHDVVPSVEATSPESDPTESEQQEMISEAKPENSVPEPEQEDEVPEPEQEDEVPETERDDTVEDPVSDIEQQHAEDTPILGSPAAHLDHETDEHIVPVKEAEEDEDENYDYDEDDEDDENDVDGEHGNIQGNPYAPPDIEDLEQVQVDPEVAKQILSQLSPDAPDNLVNPKGDNDVGLDGKNSEPQDTSVEGDMEERWKLGWNLLLGQDEAEGRDVMKAFELFSIGAEEGHPASQFALGFMHAFGLGTNSSQASALVYYTFAALGGNPEAQMAIAYRFMDGQGVPQSCEQSLSYYRRVADTVKEDAMKRVRPFVVRQRITDNPKRNQAMSQEDVVQYHMYNADHGDVRAQSVVGQLLYQGGHGVEQNFDLAFTYFLQAAQQGDVSAMGFLGEMYSRGVSVVQNYETAHHWLEKASQGDNAMGHNGLGLMYMHGRGVRKDSALAFKLISKAAAAGLSEGQLNLGTMYFRGIGVAADPRKATHYFSLAAQQGSVLAMHNLGLMHATGEGTPRSCHLAISFFKNVAERGSWAAHLSSAYSAYEDGESDTSIMYYAIMAEMGYEVAQHNLAYILDREDTELFHKNGSLARALTSWKRSAGQGYAESRVKIGDYHYYGLGTEIDFDVAAQEYRIAADESSAQALFNLGYMHELGLGLPMDFHLAKRYYDRAAETSAEAEVPVMMALSVLKLKAAWQWVTEEGWTAVDAAFESAIESVESQDYEALLEGWETVAVALLAALLVVVLLARQLRLQRLQDMQE